MKKVILSFIALVLACSVQAQGVFTINSVPMCWNVSGADSSIVANWAVGINDTEPLILGYVDAYGNAVTVIGGTLTVGFCGGSTSVEAVSITDNFDGTYTAIVNTDTTLIKADICGDTITQVSHNFSVGDLLGQNAGNGSYFLANTSSADNFPVTAVIDSIDANTFVGCNEKIFVTFEHGRPLGRDYFLQDDGSLDTIPDSTYNVFAFRTLKINKAYFDIPELIVTPDGGTGGGEATTIDSTRLLQDSIVVYYQNGVEIGRDTISLAAGGGGSITVTASNGLNDADATSNVDVELGGTLDKDTDIELGPNNFTMTRTGAGVKFQVDGGSAADGVRISPNPPIDQGRPDGSFLFKNQTSGNPASVEWSPYDLPQQAPLTSYTNAVYVYDPFESSSLGGSYWRSMLTTNSGIVWRDSSEQFFRLELNGGLTRDANLDMGGGQYHFRLTDGFTTVGLTDSVFRFKLQYDDDSSPFFDWEFDKDVGGTQYRMDIRADTNEMYFRFQEGANATVFRITPYSVVIQDPPTYASEAAADSDANLPSGGVYQLTGDRTLYIKP